MLAEVATYIARLTEGTHLGLHAEPGSHGVLRIIVTVRGDEEMRTTARAWTVPGGAPGGAVAPAVDQAVVEWLQQHGIRCSQQFGRDRWKP